MLATLFSRIAGLFRSRRLDDELDSEVRDHLERLAGDFQRRGLTPEAARLAARRQFGGIAHLQEELRDRRSVPIVEAMIRDFRYALRSVGKSPLFAATAILTLALGIGANTAIFSLIDQALLRALPVKDPQRLVLLDWHGGFIGGSMRGQNSFSYPAYRDLREAKPGGFTGIAARYQDEVDVMAGGPAQRALAELVTGNYFEVVGAGAAIGRTITPDDDGVKDGSPSVVLSYQYWTRRFGGDPGILGRSIDVNGHAMTVIGVAQRGFAGFAMMSPSDLFVPMSMKKVVTPTWDDLERRNSVWLKIFARLKPGVSLKSAQSLVQVPYHRVLENDLEAVHRDADFSREYLRDYAVLAPAAQGYDHLQKSFAEPLYLMMAMVGVLLLITCVNVANLIVSRAAARQREIAIRLSLGATRAALVRLILMESLTLSIAGGALALVLSYWVSGLLVRVMPFDNIDLAFHSAPDLRILAFTAGVSMAAALLFGLLPSLQATRAVAPSLKKNPSARLRKMLVTAQVALSLLLLVGAGLFVRSLYKLRSVDPGVDAAHILTFHTDPSLHNYNVARSRQFILDFEARLRSIPGVISAGAAVVPVLSGSFWTNTVYVVGYKPKPHEAMNIGWNSVSPGFFGAMGLPMVAGRGFNERDAGKETTVMIVNETFAKRFAPNGNAVGLRAGFGDEGPGPMEIVGVVKDMKNADIAEEQRPFHYTCALQETLPEVQVYIRTRHDPMAVAAAARRELARLDATLPMLDVETVAQRVDRTHYLDRLFAWLSGAFGLLATLLASIGLYGVTAFAVARRTQEIGIRIALGAGRRSVLRLVMREVLVLSAAGVAMGLPLALLLGRFVESRLFEMKGIDPFVTVAATAVILVVSAVAGYVPARRAARIDPLKALRYE